MKRADLNETDAVAILELTPSVVNALLYGVPDIWARATEGKVSAEMRLVGGHLSAST